MASNPLRLVERPVPEPGPGELLVRVICCGVCRTDLHLADGDLPPRAPDITPGHEVVGGDVGRPWRQVPIGQVQVGPAHAAANDPDQ